MTGITPTFRVEGRLSETTWADAPPPSWVPAALACEWTAPAGALNLGPHFDDLGPLGHGGFSVVRRARERSLGRVVALKFPHRHLVHDKRAAIHFHREARLVGALDLPGLVQLNGIGRLPGLGNRPFQCLRLVAGQTLRECFQEPPPSGPERLSVLRSRVRTIAAMARTIAGMHQAGCVHRDLKPTNVMRGRHGEVVVLDLGIAEVVDRNRFGDTAWSPDEGTAKVRTPQMVGTPLFMAPELLAGGPPSYVGDVYAIGALLFCCLVGWPRYQSSVRMMSKVLSGELYDRQALTTLPADLREVVGAALALDPKRRPQDAWTITQSLEGWLDGSAGAHRATLAVASATRLDRKIERLAAERAETDRLAAVHSAALSVHAPLEKKKQFWALQDRQTELEVDVRVARAQRDALLVEALVHSPGDARAHARLADLALESHRAAEARGDLGSASAAMIQLERHDKAGRHLRYRRGRGEWELLLERPARVALHRIVERDRCRVLGPVRDRSDGPIRTWHKELDAGAWCATIVPEDGARSFRYLFEVPRGGASRGGLGEERVPVYVPMRGEIPDGMVYVPAGPSIFGGDAQAYGHPQAAALQWLDGFAIGRLPVTHGDYLAFINAMAQHLDPDQLAVLLPQEPTGGHGLVGHSPYVRQGDGSYLLGHDIDGDVYSEDWPLTLCDLESTLAYVAWRATEDDRAYRLPWELEVERAARGVDRRWFSHGFFSDPTFAATAASYPNGPTTPPAVNAFPLDLSPYGVRQLAGGVATRCGDVFSLLGPDCRGKTWACAPSEQSARAVRGGSYAAGYGKSRACSRYSVADDARSHTVGARLAISIGPRVAHELAG